MSTQLETHNPFNNGNLIKGQLMLDDNTGFKDAACDRVDDSRVIFRSMNAIALKKDGDKLNLEHIHKELLPIFSHSQNGTKGSGGGSGTKGEGNNGSTKGKEEKRMSLLSFSISEYFFVR
ncbi:hypothetical protein GYMLUDRAFT_78022 [Collybiopsis luxurians FD-317 M1]|uniref:Uncharacterized protein n=1 Tax=Collybiopsis luxurians FD-317 M1 TaxID=944289 RepID=A0A0D0AP56_9AGAR|nr:hypothetical protein GYMLUDRAFT_78022 [Collybiopsis luxurians FD-317 M1]